MYYNNALILLLIVPWEALFSKAPPVVYFRYTMESHMISCGITRYSTVYHVISCGISGYSTGSHMTPTGKKDHRNDLPSREKDRKG